MQMVYRFTQLVQATTAQDHPIQVSAARRHFMFGIDLAVMHKRTYCLQNWFQAITRTQCIDDLPHLV